MEPWWSRLELVAATRPWTCMASWTAQKEQCCAALSVATLDA
jgi:hypothetical protein